MDSFINVSSITPPHVKNILIRPRLFERLDNSKDDICTLLLGQPAQGKSTLVASYSLSSSVPFAWVNLCDTYADAVTLFYLIEEALKKDHKVRNTPLIPSLPSKIISDQKEHLLYAKWAKMLFETHSGEMNIILDGLDQLAHNASSFDFIKVLMEYKPKEIRFILISRGNIPSWLQEYQVKQEMTIISNEELFFTIDETADFLNNIKHLNFSRSHLLSLHRLTEGWVGGIILLSEALAEMSNKEREKYLAKELPFGFKSHLFNYFQNQILKRQPEKVQEALLKSSIFDLLEPQILEELTGQKDINGILLQHVNKNLFIKAYYDEKKGSLVFRHHQLFKDFLRFKLSATNTCVDLQNLYLKAANISEQHRHLESAFDFFFKAGQFDKAACLLEQIGIEMVKKGRVLDLKNKINLLPNHMIYNSPWLLFYLCLTQRVEGVFENVSLLQKAYFMFEKQNDIEGQLLSMAYWLEACTCRGYDGSFSLAVLMDISNTLLENTQDRIYSYERAVLLYETGFCQVVRGNNPRKGAEACYESYLLARQFDDLALEVIALSYATLGFSLVGEFERADKTHTQIEDILQDVPDINIELITLTYTTNIMYYMHKGEINKAKELVPLALKQAAEQGLTFLFAVAVLCKLMFNRYSCNYEDGVEIGAYLLSLTHSLHQLQLQISAFLQLGLIYYDKGEYEIANETINQGLSILSSDLTSSETYFNMMKVVSGLLAYHGQNEKSGENLVIEALQYFQKIGSHKLLMDANYAMALLKWKNNQPAETTKYLLNGLDIASKREYSNSTLLSPGDFAKVLTLAVELNLIGVNAYLERVLIPTVTPYAQQEIENLYQHNNSEVKRKACKIGKVIHLKNVPRLYVNTLGAFSARLDNKWLDDDAWERSQAKTLLKTIITRGSFKIPKDILMEDLWPEAEMEAQESNFKVILHRLRKSLEPEIDRNFGSSYIIMKDNLVSLNKDTCEVDVLNFHNLIHKAEQFNNNRTDLALDYYEQAISLYKGDFLPEELYMLCIDEMKISIKREVVEALYKIIEIYVKLQDFSKAIASCYRCIKIDPYQDGAYNQLIKLYFQQGKRVEALKVFAEYKRILRDAFDSDPEEYTLELYNNIKNNIGIQMDNIT